MAQSRGLFADSFGSVRVLVIAATLSAALHFFALAALSGLIVLPNREETDRPLRATLVNLAPFESPTASGAKDASLGSKPASKRRSLPPPTRITDAGVGSTAIIMASGAQVRDGAISPQAQSPDAQPTPGAGRPSDMQSANAPTAPETSTAVTPTAPAKSIAAYPRRIELEYELKSSLVDGRARYLWLADATTHRYTIEGSMEADGLFASMFAGRFEQASEGQIDAGGLRPDRFSLRRGEAPAEVARFDWATKQIVHQRIRGEHVQPLTDHAQDLQSFIFQFSQEFSRPIPPERVSFEITNARRLDSYAFRVSGRERLHLAFGEVDTLHLVRITQEAGDAYEVWLSPSHQYLPVKIRFMLSGRFPVDQLATRITIEQ